MWLRMLVSGSETTPEPDSSAWFPLLADTRLQPDTRHYFDVDGTEEVTHVRLDVFRVRRRSGMVEVFSTPVDLSAQPELDDETLDGLGYTRA